MGEEKNNPKSREIGKDKLGAGASQSARLVPDFGSGLERPWSLLWDWPWRLLAKNLSPLAAELPAEAPGPFKAPYGQRQGSGGREEGSGAHAT